MFHSRVMKLRVLMLAAFLAACSAASIPPADSGFLTNPDQLAQDKRVPFEGVWVSDRGRLEMLKQRYKWVYVAPVDASAALRTIQNGNFSPGEAKRRVKNLASIASYLETHVKEAFEKPGQPFSLADRTGPFTFELDLALEELTPTRVVLNLLGSVADVILPGSGVPRYLLRGAVAIQGKLRDGASGELLAEFRDRRVDKITLVSVRDFQEFGYAKLAIKEWSNELAELLATPYSHKVEGPWQARLNPF